MVIYGMYEREKEKRFGGTVVKEDLRLEDICFFLKYYEDS